MIHRKLVIFEAGRRGRLQKEIKSRQGERTTQAAFTATPVTSYKLPLSTVLIDNTLTNCETLFFVFYSFGDFHGRESEVTSGFDYVSEGISNFFPSKIIV